ncbi:hypothetical protein OSB04_028104 [Centaurea solstitialis]|uniref:Rab-GAP TBC domain-containing protein n=1 Tax=Centaurea solstitialis TaxID=347529 RepID=A0AA38SZY8_9ASTR|nr:hypothetical protein OSB04_028104 [Centaurea solstitialis]
MVKKKRGVPDWLNSPIWSSSPPSKPKSQSPSPSPPSSSNGDRLSTSKSSSFNQPILTPPSSIPTPKAEIRDSSSRSSTSDNDITSSVDDFARQADLLQELSRKIVNIGELRRLASLGIPDTAGIRSTVWKLLLAYLPSDKGLWSSELAKKRSQYKHFKEDLLMNPYVSKAACVCTNSWILNVSVASQSEITRKLEDSTYPKNGDQMSEGKGLLARSKLPHGEHPLSLGKTSIWNRFFQDTEIIEQIDRDVKRTHPDMHFFSGNSAFAKANQESLKNILIIYAKLNPGVRYVQGMNEILAPLFYVLKNDPNEDYAVNAEADTFFCFVELLSGFQDNFCQQLDNSIVGIRSTISKLSQLLRKHDEELWRHLEVTTKVNPQFYAFRWITLLLTQEFNFADSLHIWDALLSDPEGPQGTLLRVCCAMLILVRRRLLAGDFTANLKLLQSYPSTNVSHLLYVANRLSSHSTQ